MTERGVLQLVGTEMESNPDSIPASRDIRERFENTEPFDQKTMALFYMALDRLEEDGYITKDQHPHDGRKTCVGLTEAGEEALQLMLRRAAASTGKEVVIQ